MERNRKWTSILSSSLRNAVPSTKKSCLWLLRLMIPVSLAVTLMQHFGVLGWMAQVLNPLFVHIGLPGESAVVFISGAMAGTYAGIAAMMSVPLAMKQATIIGVMIALCHALPMECAVNKMTGSSFWKMAFIRIVMAFVAALCLNALLPEMTGMYMYMGAPADSTLMEVMHTWVVAQVKMSIMVFLIIYFLMVFQRLMEELRLMRPLSHLLSPLMVVFGLPRHAAYMWLVGNVLGVSYGSAVMVEMKDKGLITRDEANDVNYHLIMNHSLVEDTIAFAVTGISATIMVPVRVVLAMVLVWTRKGVVRLKKHS